MKGHITALFTAGVLAVSSVAVAQATAAGGYTALAELAGADGKFLPLSEVKATRAK